MKKDELKQAFGGLEPTEELTKEVWTRVEKNMETVKKRKVSKIVKAAAVVLIAAGLLGGINGLSGNKLVEALVSFWHVDKESQSILKDMTDYHVMVDTVYAAKTFGIYRSKNYICREFWRCGLQQAETAGGGNHQPGQDPQQLF